MELQQFLSLPERYRSTIPVSCPMTGRLERRLIVVQSFSHVQLFTTHWTAVHQASLSFTISRSLFKLMSIESVMPSNHLILYHPLYLPLIFPSIRVFLMSWLFTSDGQSIGASASASASVLSVNIQD